MCIYAFDDCALLQVKIKEGSQLENSNVNFWLKCSLTVYENSSTLPLAFGVSLKFEKL